MDGFQRIDSAGVSFHTSRASVFHHGIERDCPSSNDAVEKSATAMDRDEDMDEDKIGGYVLLCLRCISRRDPTNDSNDYRSRSH